MTEPFIHGIEVVEVDRGPRPIRTVRSSVIGIVGTAPDAATATAASLISGTVSAKNAIRITARSAGAAGNNIALRILPAAGQSQTLAVNVTGTRITVSPATDRSGTITTTATLLIAALTKAKSQSAALINAASVGGSDGSGKIVPDTRQVSLSGGQDEAFPVNTPVLVTTRHEAARLGVSGTLPGALDAIFDQAGAWVVVIRVEHHDTQSTLKTNIIGKVHTDGNYQGVHALLSAETAVHVTPRILIAPGFTHDKAVVAKMLGIADKLRAVIIADGPSMTDAAAIDYRKNFGSARVFVIDPKVKVWDTQANAAITQPASARVAGVIAKSDHERGFWFSPSNREIYGIVGTERPVDFALGDPTARANYLNEHEVTTIIHEKGYRLWGNRTCSADPKWAFLSVRRTADMINESLLRAHLWAVDRNITRQYLEDVAEGVNAYLRDLTTRGAILGGKCWANDDLNTPQNITQGKVYFDFDFTPAYPAEHVTFRSTLVNDYLTELVAEAA